MMQEDIDKMIRGALPPVTITEERLEHFIDAVLDQAAQRPVTRARKEGWGWSWPMLMPVLRFALPMVVAVVLGITVSSAYDQDAPVAQFSTLYLSTTLVPVGS